MPDRVTVRTAAAQALLQQAASRHVHDDRRALALSALAQWLQEQARRCVPRGRSAADALAAPDWAATRAPKQAS